jgi:hypothetical protein
MRLVKLLCCTILAAAALAHDAAGAVLQPVSVRKLETPAFGVAWLDGQTLLLAGGTGVIAFSPSTGKQTVVIPPAAVPDGLPDPLSVRTDGVSVIASNGFMRTQFACSAADGKRIFARSSRGFEVIDLAVWRDNLYVLGWPTGAHGAANPDGIAVWGGRITGGFEQLLPLHRIQSGPDSVAIFNDSLPGYGGALAVERDGTVDVLTAAEPGLFQYSPSGKLLRTLGTGLAELVQPHMHEINFVYATDVLARYQRIINAQPMAEDVVATDDGPAILVRIAHGEKIGWELWYPGPVRTRARVTLGVMRNGPFGHMACGARGRELACVYQATAAARDGLEQDPRKLPTVLVRFTLPKLPSANVAAK